MTTSSRVGSWYENIIAGSFSIQNFGFGM